MTLITPIFVDTNLLVAAAERNSITALIEIRSHQVFVSPNQFREFLSVRTSSQRAARRAFLEIEGIILFGGLNARRVAQFSEFQRIFWQVVGHQGRADAALAAFAKVTNYEAVTMERRLYNFLHYTVGYLQVPIRRI